MAVAKHGSDQALQRRRLFAQADTAESPQGGIANPMTFLLLAILAVFFWWSMRRRRVQDERFREQRREETVTHAEESARNVAHIMRQAPTRASAEAAATEGLAAAARMPEQPVAARPEPDLSSDNGAAEIEMAEREMVGGREAAAARAERAAESEAADAAHRAGLEGPSEGRRVGAGLAAAAEAAADTVDIQRVEIIDPIDAADIVAPEVDLLKEDEPGDAEGASRAALRAGLAELEAESAVDVPFGAIIGDGTATCPPDYPIKGNQQSLIYHEPGQSSYAATIPEFCFASGNAAEAAGFRQSRARGGSKHE